MALYEKLRICNVCETCLAPPWWEAKVAFSSPRWSGCDVMIRADDDRISVYVEAPIVASSPKTVETLFFHRMYWRPLYADLAEVCEIAGIEIVDCRPNCACPPEVTEQK
jgi:hypothetical protein